MVLREMTMTLEETVTHLKRNMASLREYGVVSISVFGSVARGESDDRSDVDLLVEFGQPIGMFEFVRLKAKLVELLEQPVDLVTPDALHPALRASILADAVHAA